MDIAVVGAGVSLTPRCRRAPSPRPAWRWARWRRESLLVPEAAQALIGSRLDEAALDRLEAAARAACRPIDDKRGTNEFRIKVAGVLARRDRPDRARTRARTN